MANLDPEPQVSPAEAALADSLDTALSARRLGVDEAEIRRDFGREAYDLVALAERMREGGLPPRSAPAPDFVAGLRQRLALVRTPERRPSSGLEPLLATSRTELALVAGLAAAIALAAFLFGASRLINGYPTAVPTANAASTTTATALVPGAQATAAAATPRSGARRPGHVASTPRHRSVARVLVLGPP